MGNGNQRRSASLFCWQGRQWYGWRLDLNRNLDGVPFGLKETVRCNIPENLQTDLIISAVCFAQHEALNQIMAILSEIKYN